MSNHIPVFVSPEGEKVVMDAYQAVLDKWPVAYKEFAIPTSFGETYVIASGPVNAPPVVLIHTLLVSSASWYRNVEALSQSYRVFAIDVAGEGNKSQPVKPITSLDDFLLWFTEVIDSLGIDTLYLVGNSYGGFTAAYYAMKLPDRIRKLVLIGPAATITPMRPFYLHMFIHKTIYGFFPKVPGISSVTRGSVDWVHKGLPSDPLWEPFFYASMIHGGLINQVFPRMYSKEEFAQIKANVLLILVEREAIYNNLGSAMRSARKLIPNVEIEIIAATHHITALADPDSVNRKLLQFFAR